MRTSPGQSQTELSFLTAFAERVSHSLRTPLGTCLGALDDLVAGYHLGKDELLDARNSAAGILAVLDLLRDFATSIAAAEEIELGELLREAGLTNESKIKVRISRSKAAKLVRGIRAFLEAPPATDAEKLPVAVELVSESEAVDRFGLSGGAINLVISSPSLLDKDLTTVAELVAQDHRLEVFVFPLAESFFVESGGAFGVKAKQGEGLSVLIGFGAS